MHPAQGHAAQALDEVTKRQIHLARPEEQLALEEKAVKAHVRAEFQHWDHNDPVQQALHGGNKAVEHVYGGKMSSAPQELQLCSAWRPSPDGRWELANGVVHRVHHDDETVTVQFLPDQHRCRLPISSVKPQLDVTPQYPTIRLTPGQRLPTPAEIDLREHKANLLRLQLGLAPDAPLPGVNPEDHDALRPGEHMNANHTPVIESKQWGIPAPTLDALRNRSIPTAQVTGVYGEHFFSNLYRNRFYAQKQVQVAADGSAAAKDGIAGQDVKIVSHRYIPLHGQEMYQDMSTGRWCDLAGEGVRTVVDQPGFLG